MSSDVSASLPDKVRKKLPAGANIRSAFYCTLGRRPSVLVVTDQDVVVFGLTGIFGYYGAPLTAAQLTVEKDAVSATLKLYTSTHKVLFDNAAGAAEAEQAIESAVADARRALERARRRALGLPGEDFELAHDERLARSWVFLGGANLAVKTGLTVDVLFGTEKVQIYRSMAQPQDTPLVELGYARSFSIELSGPGRFTTGGGFVGGGFGLMGAAEGMAIAGLLNSLTTRTQVQSVIAVLSAEYEAFFLSQQHAPDELRRMLAPAFLRGRQLSVNSAVDAPARDNGSLAMRDQALEAGAAAVKDLTEMLERLATLHRAGALTDAEFAAAKAQALGLSS